MITFFIYYEGKLKQTFADQTTDLNAFGWLLRHQSNSTAHALKYEGWKIEVKDQETGEVTDYGTGQVINDPICNRLTDEA